jgi:lipopolysaccharide assembly protein B
MTFEFWWLLALPVFFGLGWLAARIDIRHLLSESRALPASYFKGLNFLLNEQPDKAIEAFIEVARAEQQTVELHFALGALFRRRGEVERATRMHQSLMDRTDLSGDERVAATHELALDYLKAGVLDRAEKLFSALRTSPHARSALKSLLDIYVVEKEWFKAIDVARQLVAEFNDVYDKEIANYYCELALIEASHSRHQAAVDYLDQALAANRKCVRASVLLGEWSARDGRDEEAIEHWQRIEGQNPAYLFLVADGLLQRYRALGRLREGINLLRGFQQRYPAIDILNALVQGTLEHAGAEAAYEVVREELRRNPTLPGLDKLLETRQFVELPAERRTDLQLVKDLVHGYAARLSLFQCGTCGFKARQFHWHCPACGGWETYPPRRNTEIELMGSAARGSMT